MMLMTKKIKEQLIKNFTANVNREEPIDHVPVLKLFGGGSCTWLITEYDQENDILFGLCCLLYTSPSPRDVEESRMPSSA